MGHVEHGEYEHGPCPEFDGTGSNAIEHLASQWMREYGIDGDTIAVIEGAVIQTLLCQGVLSLLAMVSRAPEYTRAIYLAVTDAIAVHEKFEVGPWRTSYEEETLKFMDGHPLTMRDVADD